MASRRQCPSCQHRLSPTAVECPVCGLALARKELPRPLLFQSSALRGGHEPGHRPLAIATPALGRVAPVSVPELPPAEAPQASHLLHTFPPGEAIQKARNGDPASDFWLLARMEAGEALLLLALNLVVGLLAVLLLRVGPGATYAALWPYLGALHLAASWTLFMVPLVLIGQSPLMTVLRLRLAAEQPERRMAFSLFHLLSVALFPLSFLCMVLTTNHRSLAELLTGQEILCSPRLLPAAGDPRA